MSTTTHTFTIDDAKAAIERAIKETPPRRRVRIWLTGDPTRRLRIDVSPRGSITAALAGSADRYPGLKRKGDTSRFSLPPEWSDAQTLSVYVDCAQRHGWTIDSQSPTEAFLSREA